MKTLNLIVGIDSTWSLRAWICLKLSGQDFDETVVPLGQAGYLEQLKTLSPSGLVPVLVDNRTDNPLKINDSLAIAEYLYELAPESNLYPQTSAERAVARTYCAQLHSGFTQLRATCPFGLSIHSPVVHTPALEQELDQLTSLWSEAQLPFMFDEPGIVDAFYAILAFRLTSYGITLAGKAGVYQQQLLEWPLLKDAISRAHQWHQAH